MTKHRPFEKVDVNIVSTMENVEMVREVPDAKMPFRIAVMGDFSGRTNRGIIEYALANRKSLLVDRDNFDEVLAKCGVEIVLPIFGKDTPPVKISFSELEDFHPDNLYRRLDVFQALRDTRKGLKDPSTFEAFAKTLQEDKDKTTGPPAAQEKENESSSSESEQINDGLLDMILEDTPEKAPETVRSRGTSGLDNFLQQIVGPHLVPTPHPRQAEMVDAVNAAISGLMRKILHHPDFQKIEAAWRALHFFVSRLETGPMLKVYLLDISREELVAAPVNSEDLHSSDIYKLLVEQTVNTFGGETWAVLVGNYTFEQKREDIELLANMAEISRVSGAPFIAAASESVLGCGSLARTPGPDDWNMTVDADGCRAWDLLRKIPGASSLGLVLPRFLLRLPYGEDTDSIETFEFEEITGVPEHNNYLWGNPSFVCAYLLGQTFAQYGWDFQSVSSHEIEGLPLHIYRKDGDSVIKPCAEVVFTQNAVEIIMDKGIMPLLSFKNQDLIKLPRLQSLAEPPTQLAGQWS